MMAELKKQDTGQIPTIPDCIRLNLEKYFAQLGDQRPSEVWTMVMGMVEKSMIEFMLNQVGYNQKKAAELLGITRNTLRKKIADYGIVKESLDN